MFKRIAWIGLLAVGGLTAHGFSLIGPYASWQVHDLGYALNGDLGGPMNIGEEFRRNTPVMYYAADANFYTFFGSNGVWSVDQAFAILNNLSPVSSYSADLSEVSIDVRRPNYTALALNLMDVKSAVLGLMMEQMGLADPIRYTWTLHDRYTSSSPNQYLVVMRNLEIVPTSLDQLQYSRYVNTMPYTYRIHDYSPATPPNGAPLSEAREFGVDVPEYMLAFTPVSALGSLAPGGFYTGLTRDDVAGLRYLLRSGNVNWEDNPPNSIAFVTNRSSVAQQSLVTTNLALLTAQSLTNVFAGLLTFYPGLIIVPGSTISSFSNVVTTNLTLYYTNFSFEPVGAPAHGMIFTNYTTNVIFIYTRELANIVTNYNATSYVTIIETNFTYPPFPTPGNPKTNIVTTTVVTNIPTGDFYIQPPNLCGIQITSNLLSAPIGVTNSVVFRTPTNAILVTNLLAAVTSNLVQFYDQSLTNNDAALVALYPGLVIVPDSTVPAFSNVITTNLTMLFANYPGEVVGTPPHGIILTNYSTNIIYTYSRQFANMVISNAPRSYVTIFETNYTYPAFPTPGNLTTNIRMYTVLTNIPSGNFYIIPTNLACGIQILSNVLTTPMALTNEVVVYTPTNAIIITNLQLFVTSNLTLLTAQSLTNNDAALQALYPDLVIAPNTTVPSFTNIITTNLGAYYTNYVYDPVGTPPHLAYVTNRTTNVMFIYRRGFANVVTNSYSTRSWVTVVDTNIYFPPTAPAGYSITNTTTTTMLTNMVVGDYYIVPTNLACGFHYLSNVLSTLVGVTNTLVITNTPTKGVGGAAYLLSRTYVNWYTNHFLAYFPVDCVTNTRSLTYINWYTNHYLAYFPVACVTNVLERTYINWYTNHQLAYFPVLCVTNEPGLRRGVEKINFVKTSYDSLLGRFYAPQTVSFTMTTVTNSTNWVQTFQRVVTRPDFLFTAQDMLPGPAADLIWNESARNIIFNATNQLNGLNGPGTIDPTTVITFNKSGPVYYNSAPANMDERTATRLSIWASYDDSTNPPVVYPNGTSIASVESQMMMQVTSTTLPPAQAGNFYTTQLTGSGGSGSPYTWSMEPDSSALPSGLSLSSGGVLSGSPATSGIYSFFVKMSDLSGGFTVWQVTLTVLP